MWDFNGIYRTILSEHIIRQIEAEKEIWHYKLVEDTANNNFDHVGTLKYINLLLHIDIHLQRVKYIINEQSMSINVFLFCSFVFLQIVCVRERERGYIKLGMRRNGLKVYLSFFRRGSCGEYFLFYGLIDFMLFLVLAWRNGSFVSEIFFCLLLPGVLGFGSVRHEPCPTTNLLFFFPWREGVPTSVLGSQPIIWLLFFFLPVSGDPREVIEYKHLFLTVILWWLATVNSNKRIVVILFLFS